jgi:excisionase family DNA binding protein
VAVRVVARRKVTTPILLSVADACRTLSIGKSSFYEAVSRGEITLKKLGKESLVAHSDLIAWASRLPDASRKTEAA